MASSFSSTNAWDNQPPAYKFVAGNIWDQKVAPNDTQAPVAVTTTGGTATQQTVAQNTKNSGTVNYYGNSYVNPSTTFLAPKPKWSPAPAAPNLAKLEAIQNATLRKENIAKAMKEYDSLEASTRSSGFQAANNAGNVYANRLMQSGVNPSASGVVAAQAKLPVYKQLAEIGVQREETRLDATNKADSLAASIASTIANINMGYAKTLADYNQQNAAYELDLNKFNAAQLNEGYRFNSQMSQQQAAQAAAQAAAAAPAATSDPTGTHLSGYVTNSGPLISGYRNGFKVNDTVFYGGGPARS